MKWNRTFFSALLPLLVPSSVGSYFAQYLCWKYHYYELGPVFVCLAGIVIGLICVPILHRKRPIHWNTIWLLWNCASLLFFFIGLCFKIDPISFGMHLRYADHIHPIMTQLGFVFFSRFSCLVIKMLLDCFAKKTREQQKNSVDQQ